MAYLMSALRRRNYSELNATFANQKDCFIIFIVILKFNFKEVLASSSKKVKRRFSN